jgi:hypothetical protein
MEFAMGPAPLAGPASTVAMTFVMNRAARYAVFGGVGPRSRVE